MGIQGLLQLLKPVTYKSTLKDFQGQCCVIDIMGWLYRGAFSRAFHLQADKQSPEMMLFPFKMLKLLLNFGIRPICIFDGRPHEGKVSCEKGRSKAKADNKAMVSEAQKAGDKDAAYKYNTRSLSIKSRQIDLMQEILTLLNIEFYVAPYEADAQMAYMVKEGIADFAITEDSDLIAFGCPQLFLKIDNVGLGEVFDYNKFKCNTNDKDWDERLRTVQNMTWDDFLLACVMGGCDYSNSIDKVGLKTVLKDHKKFGSCLNIIKSWLSNKSMKEKVPEFYEQNILKAITIFKHQTVYDPRIKRFVPIHWPKRDESFDQKYVGSLIDPADQQNYSEGKINARSLQPKKKYIDVFDYSVFLHDWKHNRINGKSFIITDDDLFFEEHMPSWKTDPMQNSQKDGAAQVSNRYGLYAYSSKDKNFHEAQPAVVVMKTPVNKILEPIQPYIYTRYFDVTQDSDELPGRDELAKAMQTTQISEVSKPQTIKKRQRKIKMKEPKTLIPDRPPPSQPEQIMPMKLPDLPPPLEKIVKPAASAAKAAQKKTTKGPKSPVDKTVKPAASAASVATKKTAKGSKSPVPLDKVVKPAASAASVATKKVLKGPKSPIMEEIMKKMKPAASAASVATKNVQKELKVNEVKPAASEAISEPKKVPKKIKTPKTPKPPAKSTAGAAGVATTPAPIPQKAVAKTPKPTKAEPIKKASNTSVIAEKSGGSILDQVKQVPPPPPVPAKKPARAAKVCNSQYQEEKELASKLNGKQKNKKSIAAAKKQVVPKVAPVEPISAPLQPVPKVAVPILKKRCKPVGIIDLLNQQLAELAAGSKFQKTGEGQGYQSKSQATN